MFNVFLTVILPIFLVAATGLIVQRWRKLSVAPLSQLTFLVLSPALIFHSLVEQDPPGDIALRISAVSITITLAAVVLALAISRALRHPRDMQSAFLLASVFPNTGNMGLPIVLLAFGEAGLATAVIILVTQSAIGWSLGIYIAARSNAVGWSPMVQVFKVPVIYAVAAAFVVLLFNWEIPTTFETPIAMLAGAALPAMLLVMGFQLGSGINLHQWGSLSMAMLLRLVVAAPMAYGISSAFGLSGVEQQAVIVSMSMPAAVFTTILASEYGATPRFVTSAVVTSTLTSLLTLTVLITIVQDWLA
jgi:predicted permease